MKNLKIVNGDILSDTLKEKYNFFASLVYKNENVPFCGGAYIGENIVISAAHCLDTIKELPVIIQVQFKKANINSKGIVFDVEKIIIHPYYNNNTMENDIAILILKGKPFQNGIKKINIPAFHFVYKSGYINKIIGYGKVSSNGNQSSQLRGEDVSIMNISDSNYNSKDIKPGMFLAGDYNNINDPNDNVDTCQGDSGGPLFAEIKNNLFLVGITSWGNGCALDKYPGIYTRVVRYSNWIYRITKIKPYNFWGNQLS